MNVILAAEAAAESGGGGGYWQLAMILAGIGFLAIFARWRKARTPPPMNTREFRNRDQEPDRYRDTADKAIVELLETSRTLNAQVDTKIRVLNRLVKDAEEQTARLEKLIAEAKGVEAADRPSAAALAAAPVGEAVPASASVRIARTELQDRIMRLKDEGRSVPEIAKTTNLSTTEVRFALESLTETST